MTEQCAIYFCLGHATFRSESGLLKNTLMSGNVKEKSPFLRCNVLRFLLFALTTCFLCIIRAAISRAANPHAECGSPNLHSCSTRV